ncbi:MAG: type II secretion system protein GspI [Alphaproteobacteria bacterium]|nr:type II secretion system protein GspI [Alphaproteobacteria bacterium]
MSHARNDGGFSLVEALVALAVFALAGVALVQLQAQSLRTLSAAETRALARIVVQNALVDVAARSTPPELGGEAGEAELGGRTWRWRTEIEATADPLIRSVRATAYEGDAQTPVASAQAFVAAQ